MGFDAFFRRRVKSEIRARDRRPGARRGEPRSRRMLLEPLEERWLLSVGDVFQRPDATGNHPAGSQFGDGPSAYPTVLASGVAERCAYGPTLGGYRDAEGGGQGDLASLEGGLEGAVPAAIIGTSAGGPPLLLADTGEIRGTKFNDLDGDGVRDAGEPGLAGVMIYLDTNKNGLREAGEPTTLTDMDDPATTSVDETGSYVFDGLAPGTYVATEIVPLGYKRTYPDVPDTEPGMLSHVVTYRDGDIGTSGLVSASAPTISPDGAYLYCVSGYYGQAGLAVFRRDVADGSLSFVQLVDRADLGPDRSFTSRDIAVSSDGAHLYATMSGTSGDGIAVLARDGVTGNLSVVEVLSDGVEADELDDVLDISISPDDRFVYAASSVEHAVTVFGRDLAAGRLTTLETVVSWSATSMVISPDGAYLYTASRNLDALRVYQRDQAAGTLSEIGVIQGTTDDTYLSIPESVSISPDGNHLYVTSAPASYLAAIQRDSATGMGSVVQRIVDDTWVDGLDWARDPVLSPDGSRVYVCAYSDESLSAFSRDATTGELAPLQLLRHGDPDVDGLQGAEEIAISPDGRHVYLTNSYPAFELTLFERDTIRGHVIDLADGAVEVADFGNQSIHGEIQGTKWDDRDGDGIRDPGEPGLAGVTVYLDLNDNAQLDAGEPSVLTDDDDPATTGVDETGTYQLAGVVPGTYLVREIVPGGYAATYPATPAFGSGKLTYAGIVRNGDLAIDGLDGAYDSAISPDDKHLYVAGTDDNALAIFRRETAGGELSFVRALVDNVDGVDGLAGARSVEVSPDGMHVYVAGYGGELTAFSRNDVSGDLAFVEAYQDGVGGVDGLAGATYVSLSPDGSHVYVAGSLEGALAVFSRDPDGGALSFVEVLRDGAGGVDGLGGVHHVVVSPDGNHVYAAARNDDAVALFSREATTGRLSFIEAITDGAGGVVGLDGAAAVSLTPDGIHAYVAAYDGNAVTVFSREATSGRLAFIETIQDGQALPGGTGTVDGLGGAIDVALTPGASRLYVLGQVDNQVAIFSREAATGRLTFVESRGGSTSFTSPTSLVFDDSRGHVYVTASQGDSITLFVPHPVVDRLIYMWELLDGQQGVYGIDGAMSVTVSPDGNHVYTTSMQDGAFSVFARDPQTGALTFVQAANVSPSWATSIVVSPDGNNVYATTGQYDTLYVGARDSLTGQLTWIQTFREGVDGVTGLDWPEHVTVTPDGDHVYVASDPGTIAVFSRDSATGLLTFGGVTSSSILDGATWVSVSPDGQHVYATADRDHALVALRRDLSTGSLTVVDWLINLVSPGANGLYGASAVLVSPDGRHLYTTGKFSDAVAVFSRDQQTGEFTFIEVHRDGVWGVDGLGSARSLAIDPAGKYLYAVGSSDNAVAVFRRDTETGRLAFVQVLVDNVDVPDGLGGPYGVAVSPDDLHVYVAATSDDAVTSLARDDHAHHRVTVGPQEVVQDVDFGNVQLFDFGDAPGPYPTLTADGGAGHVLTGPSLGTLVDAEPDGQPTASADGDDTTGVPDDEDGVTFGSTIRVGQLGASVTVNVQNAPSGARLDAWIDFNADGSWGGPFEQIADSVAVTASDNIVTFDVPSWTVDGTTFARFRVSTGGGLGPDGPAADGEVEDYQVTIHSAVVDRRIFYDNSYWDGGIAGPNTTGGPGGNGDDGAIATDKSALLPGGTATSANFTTYDKGINGIMVDVAGLADPTAVGDNDFSEFAFRVGNDNNPSEAGWTTAAAPTDVDVRDLGGGVHRVSFFWAAGAIPTRNWLQLTLKADAVTGLAQDDVFYFGNAIGDANLDCKTLYDDIFAIYSNVDFVNFKLITDPCDTNRDGKVLYDDIFACYSCVDFTNQLVLITPPMPPSTPGAGFSAHSSEEMYWVAHLAALDELDRSSDDSEEDDRETAADAVFAAYGDE